MDDEKILDKFAAHSERISDALHTAMQTHSKIDHAITGFEAMLKLLDNKITRIGEKADAAAALAGAVDKLSMRMDAIEGKLDEIAGSRKFRLQSAIGVCLGVVQSVCIAILLALLGLR